MSFIRAVALQGYPDLVTELGGDADALLARAAVDPAAIGTHEAFIPWLGFVQAVDGAADELGVADFGRQLAERQGIEVFGALGAVATTAPTLGEGLGLVDRYVSVFAPALAAGLDVGPDTARFWFSPTATDLSPEDQAQSMELLVGRMMDTVLVTVGAGFQPLAVLIPHAAVASDASYAEYFGTEVRFDEPAAGLAITAADLDRPLPRHPEGHRVVQAYLEELHRRADDGSLAANIRRAIERSLPGGVPELSELATTISVHPRTLQRHLAAEGTTLAAIVEALRQELTTRYLADPRLSFSEVARMLGYSQQSVLTRSCRRWFGETPSALRSRLAS